MLKTAAALVVLGSLSGCGKSEFPRAGAPRSETQELTTLDGRWIPKTIKCEGIENFLGQPEVEITKDHVAVIGTLSDNAVGSCRRAIAYTKNTSSFSADTLQVDESGVLMFGYVRTRCVDPKGSVLDDRTDARPGDPLSYKLHLNKSSGFLQLAIKGLLECPHLSLGLRRK